jgi:cation diffusion facilitator CzcD-associated flavoprotein CzcO
MLDTAIIGAGPYGLSIAAHFRASGIPFRIFGRPMDSWVNHMPKGMMLKSDGFASNIYDPENAFTLGKFCAQRGIEYSDAGVPVKLDTFSAYGLAFRQKMLPELEEKLVVGLERAPQGFLLRLDSGETLTARRVVLAIGITHFEYTPESLAHLPSEFLSHSFRHTNPSKFNGRSVVVIGGGSSAIDIAAELHQAGADVQLIARRTALKFHSTPTGKPRSSWQRIRHPQSGLGPGLRSRFFSDAPGLFHYLPENLRLKIVERTLGPSAGWFVKDKMAQVHCLLGSTLRKVELQNGKVHLNLLAADGTDREVVTEHVIAATGYKVDLDRLGFLSGEIRSKIKTVKGSPILSSAFESSVPGIYFAGLAAASSFGPVMRFAFGAGFAARRLTQTMTKALADNPVPVAVRSVATSAK